MKVSAASQVSESGRNVTPVTPCTASSDRVCYLAELLSEREFVSVCVLISVLRIHGCSFFVSVKSLLKMDMDIFYG